MLHYALLCCKNKKIYMKNIFLQNNFALIFKVYTFAAQQCITVAHNPS